MIPKNLSFLKVSDVFLAFWAGPGHRLGQVYDRYRCVLLWYIDIFRYIYIYIYVYIYIYIILYIYMIIYIYYMFIIYIFC